MPPKKRKKRKSYSKTKASKNLAARRGSLVLVSIVSAVILLVAIYHLFAYTGSLFFSRNPAFDLKTIELTTDGRLSTSELKRWVGIDSDANLFAIDFDEVRANLRSKPQIEEVFIQRKLPSTLVVRVVEREAVVRIQFRRSGFLYLLDRHGIAMRPSPTRSSEQALPLIEGLKVKEPRVGERAGDPGIQCVLDILAVSDALGLGAQVRFEKFNLHYPDFITVQLNEEVSARFPRHSAREKLVRLVRVLQMAREQGRRVKTVDLIPDGLNVPITYY
jgi:cell division septal protein FtsQ